MAENILNTMKAKNKKAFIPFIVVGHPDLAASKNAVDALIAEGADLIELGVPFSDPVADGPVIQAASEQASHTTSLNDVLNFAKEALSRHPGFPFVLFTYYNPIFKMGVAEFVKRAKNAGINAVLVVDLPPEEAQTYIETMKANDLQTVFLASPTTTKERLRLISDASTAFVYYVSRAGVTGTQNKVSKSLAQELSTVRQLTPKAIAVGFGISTGEQARQVSKLADAVVVGSAFVKLKTVPEIRALAKEIRSAVDTF